jgi:hypothetical protein
MHGTVLIPPICSTFHGVALNDAQRQFCLCIRANVLERTQYCRVSFRMFGPSDENGIRYFRNKAGALRLCHLTQNQRNLLRDFRV